MNWIKDKGFLRVAVISFACILVIFSLLSTVFFSREQRAIREENEAEIQQSLGYSAEYLQDVLMNEYLTSTQLASTPWVIRIAAGEKAFADQFKQQALLDASLDFLFKVQINSEILYRSVFFPNERRVMSSHGLNGAEYYFRQLGIPSGEIGAFLEELETLSSPKIFSYAAQGREPGLGENLLLVNPIQKREQPSAYLCTLLNTSVIRRQITHFFPESVTGFLVTESETGLPVMGSGEKENDSRAKVFGPMAVSMLQWEMEFYADETLYAVPSDVFHWMTVFFLVAVIIILPVSFLLAMYIYRLLAKLRWKLPGDSVSRDIYRDVSDSISELVRTLRSNEKETCLRQLVTGTFQPENTGLALLPDYQQLFVQTVLLHSDEAKPNHDAALEQVDGILENMAGIHKESIVGYDNMLVLIFSAHREETLAELDECLLKKFPAHSLFLGSICKGHIGIAISFQSALKKKQYRNLSGVPDYYLPIGVEHQLLLALRSGKESEATDILNQLLDKNDMLLKNGTIRESDIFQLGTVLTNDMIRTVAEKNLNRELLDPLEGLEYSSIYDVFGRLNVVAMEICALLSARSDSVNVMAQKIVDYIDAHYAESTLSIMVLQDVFGMSANTINKNIKEVVGSTFLPYLTYVRMEKAKELLAAGDMKISEVCRQVGYDQEYSFRRAFIRYSGFKPQNFIAPGEEDES